MLCCRQHWRLGLLRRAISINHSAQSFPLLLPICNLSHYASRFDSSVVSRTTLKMKLQTRAMFVQPFGDRFQISSLLTSPNVNVSLIPDVFTSVAKHGIAQLFCVSPSLSLACYGSVQWPGQIGRAGCCEWSKLSKDTQQHGQI